MKILFFFIDALGLGVRDPQINPCCHAQLRIFNRFQDEAATALPFDGVFKSLDATLGMPGRPQSATGQTTLLTGHNAAQLFGRHKTGYPNQTLRELLFEHSIFKKIKASGKNTAFLNVFPPIFFENQERLLNANRLSATTLATLAADIGFATLDDLYAERALTFDFTNRLLIEKGYTAPIWTPAQAGEILAKACAPYDFSLYEFFLTDKAGHAQDMAWAQQILLDVEALLDRLLGCLDLTQHLVVLTSDHGGVEDLSTRNHTRNPVMAFAWGAGGAEFLAGMSSIEDFASMVRRLGG